MGPQPGRVQEDEVCLEDLCGGPPIEDPNQERDDPASDDGFAVGLEPETPVPELRLDPHPGLAAGHDVGLLPDVAVRHVQRPPESHEVLVLVQGVLQARHLGDDLALDRRRPAPAR